MMDERIRAVRECTPWLASRHFPDIPKLDGLIFTV